LIAGLSAGLDGIYETSATLFGSDEQSDQIKNTAECQMNFEVHLEASAIRCKRSIAYMEGLVR
jgi:hypothetical protein